VLVLSEFAGAAHELTSALIVNPYDTSAFASALARALEMPASERRERMDRLRKVVEERNVYRWAADFLTTLAEVPIPAREPVPLEPEYRYAPGGSPG
jgi:trehalose 6-phosphate synthase